MAETTPLAVYTDVMAAGMVSGGVGVVERSSTGPRAQSSRSRRVKFTWSVPNSVSGPGKQPSYGW